MIQYVTGNLLQANVEALINTVNCVGIMGKGIALQFKQAFPANFDAYAKACQQQQIQIGKMFVFNTDAILNPRFIINFPTKKHWRGKSELHFIEQGLTDLKKIIQERHIQSIAIPPLGCGNGGLDWEIVKPLIENAFIDLADVLIYVYAPTGTPASDQMPINTRKPKMTRARALLIKLIELYAEQGYRLSLLEIQKLAYFLQEAGEPLKLNFQPHHYGPYAENLHYVLQHIEGHFIRGYGDRDSKPEIYLLPEAVQAANAFLQDDQAAQLRLNQVARLIEGFETPYSMELLATVHWISKTQSAQSLDDIQQAIQQWSARKANLMPSKHIQKALTQLEQSIF
jgi:O-acetyl-ADP-ribose deacetylase (regulator of RNase III)